MKKLLPAASLLVFSVFAAGLRASAPARAAQNAGGQGLEARVAALEGELASVKKSNEETQALLAQTLTYLDKQTKAAQTLLAALDEVEKQGFAVGENWRSRETLLAGMRAYWSGVGNGLPKPPSAAAAPAKPAAPPARTRPGQ